MFSNLRSTSESPFRFKMNFLKRAASPESNERQRSSKNPTAHRKRLAQNLLKRDRKTLDVLVVNSNRTNRKMVTAMLLSLKIKADEASSATEALQLCDFRRYDLIIMDCIMPDIDGFEATSRIRSSSTCINNTTPIIAVSSLGRDQIETQGIAAGMNDALTNPLHVENLARLVNKWTQPAPDTLQATRPMDQSAKIVDLERLTEICHGDIEKVLELIRSFSELLIYEMAQLQKAVRDGYDTRRISRHAQAIKNSSEVVLARRLEEAALSVVQSCEQGEIEQAVNNICNVVREGDHVKTAIKQILN